MTISAQIIADSISPGGVRITTMQLRYPRFIHAEFMTHRVFSRNASSSRAIPVAKMIEDLRRDPAMPVFWGSNKPGMQAGDEITGVDRIAAEGVWKAAMEGAIFHAESLIDRGLHKQIANRILEPWAHINVVVTATDWENFFQLRRHKDAQPEIHELADRMYLAMHMSKPETLPYGEWHMPYIIKKDWDTSAQLAANYAARLELLKLVSVARCARVSYLTHDGRETSVEEDIALANKLIGAVPLHASPAEHQATPDQKGPKSITGYGWQYPELHKNFTGWIQYRATLPDEFVPG